MKQLLFWIFWAAAIAALTGCSTLKVSQDYGPGVDFATLKTYSWQKARQPETGDIRVDSPLIDQRIRGAIEKHLALKGIELSQTDLPDFTVTYTYNIISKIQSTPVTTGVGIGYGGSGSIGTVGVRTGSDIRQYDQGLLVVDFLDPKTEKLLWRGTSTRVVSVHATPEKITEDIDVTIEKLLEQFPPE